VEFPLFSTWVKRKKKAKRKSRAIRDEVPLPLSGPLAPFTKLVLEYLQLIENPEDKLFPIGRNRPIRLCGMLRVNGLIGLEVRENLGMEKCSQTYSL
jgi:hypothetical protein